MPAAWADVGDRRRTDLGDELGVDGVHRLLRGVGEGELAEAAPAVVLDRERRAVDVDLDLPAGREAVVERGAVARGRLGARRA